MADIKELNLAQWLQYKAELDFIYYALEDTAKAEAKLSPIARMIDKSTGYDKQKLKDVKRYIRRANKLKALLGIE